MTKKRIFIVNAHPGGNKGAEAMLETVVSEMASWQSFMDQHEIWFEMINESPEYEAFARRNSLPERFFKFEPRRLAAPYKITPNNKDIMLDIGGIAYHDKSAKANIRNYLRHRFFASRDANLIFFTQDFGPAKHWLTRQTARLILNDAQLVFSRSIRSRKLLEDAVPKARVLGPYPDCTLCLPSTTPPEPIKAEDYVVVVPSAIMWNEYGDRYLGLLVKICDRFPKHYSILVLAHNFTSNDGTTDLAVCDRLFKLLEQRRHTLLHNNQITSSQFKGVFLGARAVVTSRFHAMVGSLSCNVPAFAIGWSHKYPEFLSNYKMTDFSLQMDDLARDEAGMEQLADEIVDKLTNSFDYNNVKEKNKELIQLVQSSFSELRDALGASARP